MAQAIVRGDEEAFSSFYEDHFDRLYSFVFHRVGANHAVAEEMVQSSFVTALEALPQFEGRSQLYTWLCAIARHKIGSYFRRKEQEERRQSGLRVLEGGLSELEQTAAAGPSLEETVLARNARKQVGAALQALPAQYQLALVLKYVDDLSVAAISHEMQRSVKGVESLLSRARVAFTRSYRALEGGANER